MNNEELYLSDAIGVIEEVLSSGGEFRLYPKGTSMLPLLVQGKDSVVLKRREASLPAKKHDIAFYRRENGQFILHRVMKIESDGTYTMCGDNQSLLEQGIYPRQIIGYVSEIYKEDRVCKISSLRYRIYVFFWSIMPFRKAWRLLGRIRASIKRRLFGKKQK